ncbi:aminoglycoside 6-adenylyltransferase [Streptomyces natalensis]|uniref:Aminoglycoside adenylyltransferase n=1 Tax=Streptomyces natalensis ATCC 27448 TaxID=1240678 RepID=A0A0D7CHH1_9ACTN|nr:aminoglycoside 6-adenylyltransferase [Streptomyces natalensis]KIZ15501.1 aminoglycoside adenylyltransferase [Streptomyces natalensis ATCC 27448]
MHDAFIARLLDWASARPDIAAVLRTGSRARRDGTVDALSDHDIELYTTDPGRYENGDDWLGELGTVAVAVDLEGPWDNPACLVFFDGGLKADFQVMAAERLATLADNGLDELHERGYEVLFDRDGAAARLPAPTGAAPKAELPDAGDFHDVCAEFWHEIAHLPRYAARGELWVVKARDWTTKELLQTMIEWHAQSRHGAGHDVWHLGTRMRVWAAPGVWERLDEIFGGFDPHDALRAARATADLFAELAHEVADTYGFTYPEGAERAIRPTLDSPPSLDG